MTPKKALFHVISVIEGLVCVRSHVGQILQSFGCVQVRIHMDFKSERWSSFQSNHSLGFPWLYCNLQKPSLLLDLLLYTMNYPHLSPSRKFILNLGNLPPFLSITWTPFVFNKTLWTPLPSSASPTYSGHEVWFIRHQACLPGELCVCFDLKLWVGNPELNISLRSNTI